MRHDHSIEIPFENPPNRLARRTAIGNHGSDQSVRSEMTGGGADPVEHARLRRTLRGDVEYEVRENQSAGRAVEKYHLIQNRRAAKQVLLDHTAPIRVSFLIKYRVEFQILALLRETGRAVEFGVRIGLDIIADEQVMS